MLALSSRATTRAVKVEHSHLAFVSPSSETLTGSGRVWVSTSDLNNTHLGTTEYFRRRLSLHDFLLASIAGEAVVGFYRIVTRPHRLSGSRRWIQTLVTPLSYSRSRRLSPGADLASASEGGDCSALIASS
jgi:hypothetical protein